MKVLTAAQMREIDLRTIEMGIAGIVLMENAGHRVVEFLAQNSCRCRRSGSHPLKGQQRRRWLGGGTATVRTFRPAKLDVVLLAQPKTRCRGESACSGVRMPAGERIVPSRDRIGVVDALLGPESAVPRPAHARYHPRHRTSFRRRGGH
jgi:hypothetical protein